jgi:hypothetical protein
MVHVQLRAAKLRTVGPLLSFPSKITPGESGASPATRRTEAQASQAVLPFDKLFWVLA